MRDARYEITKQRVQDKLAAKRLRAAVESGTKLATLAKQLRVSPATLANVLLGSARRGSEALVGQRWRELNGKG